MKRITFLITMVFFALTSFARPSESGSKTEKEAGIQFHEGNWQEALQKAREEGKPVFLDISASWCGPCKMLKSRTFPDDEVGEYYNANFVNVMVDGEKGEGLGLARKYKIRGYPTLIYLDSNGEVIAQTAGYRNAEQFIEIGKQIINR